MLPRAFAAELLVPADELCLQVAGEVSYEQIAGLAREFGVRDRVIKHQIENHHLALIGRNL